MTGYLYQCELALLELAQRSWEDARVEVRMEVLDDIEFLREDTDDPFELLQSKHRGDAGQISETGKDVWRSVTSWIDALATLDRLSADTMPLLRLVTTQVAAEGTFLHMLRSGPGRQIDAALARMEEVAGADEPEGTAKDRQRFTSLTAPQRFRLVSAMEVSDGSPLMSDLDPSLAKALGIRPGRHSQAILHEIKGWWYAMAVELLERRRSDRPRDSVGAQELHCRLDEVTDRYVGRNLPVTETLRRLTAEEVAAYQGDLAVSQLRWIGLKDRAIATYLRDYHFARAQRSEWIRTFKITEDGLEAYELLLWDEWDHIFNRHTHNVGDSTPESERQKVGRDILDDTMDKVADKPARQGSTTEGWIGRGTMHSLASRAAEADDDEAVGWHPDFGDLRRGPCE